MTTLRLVEDLAEELGKVLRHLTFPNELAGESTPINIYRFGVPAEETSKNGKNKFPYVLILPEKGTIAGTMSPWTVKVRLRIGIFDGDRENEGKGHVLNVINDVCERFLRDPVLAGKYYAAEKITWGVDKKDKYPYHYGSVCLSFETAVIRRENEFL